MWMLRRRDKFLASARIGNRSCGHPILSLVTMPTELSMITAWNLDRRSLMGFVEGKDEQRNIFRRLEGIIPQNFSGDMVFQLSDRRESLSPQACSIYLTIEMFLKYGTPIYCNVRKPQSILMRCLFTTTMISVISTQPCLLTKQLRFIMRK